MQINQFFITKELSIRSAIKKLDETAKKILLVVENKRLIGVLTDGDIRRWILKGGSLASSVDSIMNKNPISVIEEEKIKCENLMKHYGIEAIPIINKEYEVVDMMFWSQLYGERFHYSDTEEIPVVIMAGGKGSRLYPYTKIIPKPLIPIGEIPIVERIMESFLNYQFKKFYLTINYKAEMIKAYFSQQLPYEISFIEEPKPLGTAGSLKLLQESIKGSFFVSNCDILVEGNYSHILKYHHEKHNQITIVAVLKNYVIPYGVIQLNNEENVSYINEKPKYEFLINSGMYIMESEILEYIETDKYVDMTQLIETCISKGLKVGIYPITESAWLDMGEFKEMKNMIEQLNLS